MPHSPVVDEAARVDLEVARELLDVLLILGKAGQVLDLQNQAGKQRSMRINVYMCTSMRDQYYRGERGTTRVVRLPIEDSLVTITNPHTPCQ